MLANLGETTVGLQKDSDDSRTKNSGTSMQWWEKPALPNSQMSAPSRGSMDDDRPKPNASSGESGADSTRAFLGLDPIHSAPAHPSKPGDLSFAGSNGSSSVSRLREPEVADVPTKSVPSREAPRTFQQTSFDHSSRSYAHNSDYERSTMGGNGSDAAQWQEALRRASTELGATSAKIWLHLGGLGLPNGVTRRNDLGVRFCVPRGRSAGMTPTAGYDELNYVLGSASIGRATGWGVCEMGCSLFAHGPLALFAFEQSVASNENIELGNALLRLVSPRQLYAPVRRLATSSGVHVAVSASVKDGDAVLGLRCIMNSAVKHGQPSDAQSGAVAKDFLQALAVDLAIGQTKVFDPFILERLRQMLTSVGAPSTVAAIECRAEDPARVTLHVVPDACLSSV